jgi:hypothetical protein
VNFYIGITVKNTLTCEEFRYLMSDKSPALSQQTFELRKAIYQHCQGCFGCEVWLSSGSLLKQGDPLGSHAEELAAADVAKGIKE